MNPNPELWTTHNIAAYLSLSRQRADQITRLPHFPNPYMRAGHSRLWHASAVRDWVATWPRKTGRPRKTVPGTAETPATTDSGV